MKNSKKLILGLSILLASNILMARVPDPETCFEIVTNTERDLRHYQKQYNRLTEYIQDDRILFEEVNTNYPDNNMEQGNTDYYVEIWKENLVKLKRRKIMIRQREKVYYDYCGSMKKRDRDRELLTWRYMSKNSKLIYRIVKEKVFINRWQSLKYPPKFKELRDFSSERSGY